MYRELGTSIFQNKPYNTIWLFMCIYYFDLKIKFKKIGRQSELPHRLN